MAVGFVGEAVCYAAKLDFGNVLEVEYLAVGSGAHHDVAELFGGGESSAVAHGVLERLVALLAE